jgi:hypothetical protein
VYLGNPGGRAHSEVKARYVRWDGVRKITPFIENETGEIWAYCHTVLQDNPFLPPSYLRRIMAVQKTDPELAKGWITGSWDLHLGSFFGTCLDRRRNRTRAWSADWDNRGHWEIFAAYDHGTAAPAAVTILARALDNCRGGDGAFHCRGDIVLVDEWTTALAGQPNKGDGSSIPQIAERIMPLFHKWRIAPVLVSDDAVFANVGLTITIPDQFSECGIKLIPAKKGQRIDGWNVCRTLCVAAQPTHLREEPAFYYSEDCKYFEECAFAVEHDRNNREDCDSNGADHILDAWRYGITYILRPRETVEVMPLPFDPAYQDYVAAKHAATPQGRKKLRERGITSLTLNRNGRLYAPDLGAGT